MLRSGNRRKDIKGGSVRADSAKHVEVFVNTRPCIVREADHVGKLDGNFVFAAQSDNLTIGRRVVLCFMRGEQCCPVERFHANKHFEASGPPKQVHKLFLSGNLSVALDKKGNVDLFFNHPLK